MLRAILSTIILSWLLADLSAFQAPAGLQSKLGRQNRGKGPFELGPIARNGLAYEDVTLGQGRRILPGDTVYVYYVGSYAKGRFGGRTVFDQTCKL